MAEGVVITGRKGSVLNITINRPDALNALNQAVVGQLKACFHDATAEDSVRAIVLSGAGEKAFVAGADIKELIDLSPAEAERCALSAKAMHDAIRVCPKPVIAAINGYCLGGGFELALACDLRIAAETARFGMPEIKLGVLPGGGGTAQLSRIAGAGIARALCLSGDMITAERAYALGIVSEVVASDALARAAAAKAEELAALSPVAVRQVKSLLDVVGEVDLESAQAAEAKAFALCFASEDHTEGMQAFIEKRKPAFADR